MNKELRNNRNEEIQGIAELLEEVMKEEGYEIVGKYSDRGYKSFELQLRNSAIEPMQDKVHIKIEYDVYD